MIKKIYQTEVVPQLKGELGKGNIYGVPTVVKIVVNMGVGAERGNKESLEKAKEELAKVTGQAPAVRLAKKAVASFNLKKGELVGLTVTLRGKRMWDFLEKLIKIVLPRTKGFKGISRKSFDRRGNLTIGIEGHTSFPEVDPHKVDKVRGMEVTIVTNSGNDEKAYRVLKGLGMPFREDASKGSLVSPGK